MSEIVSKIVFRDASAADQPIVTEICAEIWGGQDYVPEVWLEWAKSPDNLLFILEVEGLPAACYCLRLNYAGVNSSWVQGVRVAVPFQRRGLARAIMEHAIRVTKEHKLAYLRYTTNTVNTPMHWLADQLEFEALGNWQHQLLTQPAETATGTLQITPVKLEASHLEQCWQLFSTTPEFTGWQGFICDEWRYQPLTRELLLAYLANGHVSGVLSPEGKLETAAIFYLDEQDGWRFVFSAGTNQLALLQTLVKAAYEAAQTGNWKFEVFALIPQSDDYVKLLTDLNFQPDKDEAEFVLYELAVI